MAKIINKFKQRGESNPIMLLLIAVLAIMIVMTVIEGVNTINADVAISTLDVRGYTVFAAGEYASITSTLSNIEDEATIVDHHFHNRVRWFGISADQSGDNWASSNNLTPFVATSGNDAWGTDATDYAKIIGSDDTPIRAGMTKFDAHELIVEDNSSGSIYKCRLIWGTGTVADAITAGQYSEFVYLKPNADRSRDIIELRMPQLDSGTQVWLNVWNATNDATLEILIGVHEYQ